jgi:MYXO-CTERM domain-containing protein
MTDRRTTAQIEADIERQRDDLADTVEQLTYKLDVKAQARAKASHLQDRATTETGRLRPEVVAGAVSFVALVALFVWRRRR